MKNISLSVFFPFYNDEGSIRKIVNDTLETLKEITEDYEIILVDDHSPDKVGEIADELAKENPKIKVIHHEKNRGYGGALKSGFSNSTKEYIFYTDGDNQYDVKELKLLVDKLDEDTDLVNGYKLSRGDPWYRKLIGRTYHWTVKILFNLKIRDVDCDFRLIRRKLFDQFDLESNSGVICVELMKKIHMQKAKIKEVPVHHYPRYYGKSQFFNFKRIFKVGIGILNQWYKLILLKKNGKRSI
ncbi:MAG: glycosyltransferase family 2 protein [Candidatus Woesearchaeota archaeon]